MNENEFFIWRLGGQSVLCGQKICHVVSFKTTGGSFVHKTKRPQKKHFFPKRIFFQKICQVFAFKTTGGYVFVIRHIQKDTFPKEDFFSCYICWRLRIVTSAKKLLPKEGFSAQMISYIPCIMIIVIVNVE